MPKKADVKDIDARVVVDVARRQIRMQTALGAGERVKDLYDAWSDVKRGTCIIQIDRWIVDSFPIFPLFGLHAECIDGSGLADISESLRSVTNIKDLPVHYVKAIEWLRNGMAEGIFDIFIAHSSSNEFFAKVSRFLSHPLLSALKLIHDIIAQIYSRHPTLVPFATGV